MKRTKWTREQPLDPPDDGLDEDERRARDDARERIADMRHDAERIEEALE